MKDFAARTAFITGGANGIGLGLARALLTAGCKVAIADIRQDSLDAALKELDNPSLMGVQLDVRSREDFARVADDVENRLGPVSLLFNNAGINLFQTIDESSYDDWDWVLGVNLNGVINGIQTFVPRIKKNGLGGHIVNTASMASFLCSGAPGIYNCSKFAVRGLSESLRYSLAPQRIGVSVLCPGLVNSVIYKSDDVRPEQLKEHAKPMAPEFRERMEQVHEVGMAPDEVASKVLDAIRANRFYIFSHPEFKEELREVFEEVLAEFIPGDADPRRLDFENGRRASYKAARMAARGEF